MYNIEIQKVLKNDPKQTKPTFKRGDHIESINII